MHIIGLVDGDSGVLPSISSALEPDDYKVVSYSDGYSALSGFGASPPDLAIVAIQMPNLDGMETLLRLRRFSNIPIILLTTRSDDTDEVLGLRMGAEDVIRKPFSPRVLGQRVKTVLTRISYKAVGAVLECGQLRIDTLRYVCTWKDSVVPLTNNELQLLQAMASRPGVVKTRDALIDATYGDNVLINDRAIDSYIKRIRKKFKAIDYSFDLIETINRIGYRVRALSECRTTCARPSDAHKQTNAPER